jgi:molecular chaperone Hsp33
MTDRLIKGIAEGQVKFTVCDCTEAVGKAAGIHGLSLSNVTVLGKLLCAGAMLGADFKTEKNILTILIEGNGPSGNAIVTSNSKAHVRGMIKNPGSVPEADGTKDMFIDRMVLGEGSLRIIKDLGLKSPYTGTIEMKYGNIANDLTYYFAASEQIPTSIGLGVLIFPDGTMRKAGGFMIQMMPGYTDGTVSLIEKNLKSFPNLTDLLDMGYDLEHIASKMLLKGLESEVLEEKNPEYRCGCSRKKMLAAVNMLKKEEIKDELGKNGFIEVKCHFCNKSYKFKAKDFSI